METYIDCSSLSSGVPQVRVQSLDCVLRPVVRLIGGFPKFGHISEFLRDTLRWLPVRHSSIQVHCHRTIMVGGKEGKTMV